MLVHRGDQLVQRQFQLLRRALHDADVGLVRDQPVQVFSAATGLFQHRARRAIKHTHGQLEHRRPIHLQQRVAQHMASGHGARHAQDADVTAIRVQFSGQDAGLGAGFKHHGAGAVTKEHAGGAVIEIEDAREDFGPHHQRAAGGAGLDHRVGHRQRIDKARANGLHVEGGATMDAQLVLQDAGGGREDHVRCRRGDDDQVHLIGLAAGCLQGGHASMQCQVAAVDAVGCKVAGADAGAFDDPFVAGLKPALGQHCRHVRVAQSARRQVAAGAGDAGKTRRLGRDVRCLRSRGQWIHAAGFMPLFSSRVFKPRFQATCADPASPAGSACSVGLSRSCTRSRSRFRAAS